MLNAPLYNALTRIFGDCMGIVNEDDSGSFTLPQRKGGRFGKKTKLYAHVDEWGEVYHFNCPHCGDMRGRLYVSYFTGESIKSKSPAGLFSFGYVYHCKNNNCNLTDYFKKLRVDKSETTAIQIKPSAHTRYVSMPAEFPVTSLPIISSEVPDYVLDYLHERRFSPAYLDKYFSVRFVKRNTVYQQASEDKGERQFYEDRLLIPIIQGGRCVSWQARRIGDMKGDKYKYLFPSHCRKNTYLYNMDNAKFHSDMVLVEGVTDAWRVGGNAVALFGKTASKIQIEMMRHLWGFNGQCVIVLDPDAWKESLKLVETLRELKIFPRGVTALRLADGTDPAMYSQAQLSEEIEKAKEYCR